MNQTMQKLLRRAARQLDRQAEIVKRSDIDFFGKFLNLSAHKDYKKLKETARQLRRCADHKGSK